MSDTAQSTDAPAAGSPSEQATVSGAAIRLDEVTKRYPGSTTPAVDRISLDIRAGELIMLVGPSGCGKTTTMRMINRLIEPTSGRILIDDEDVLALDANKLRRGIGYVIQQVGLFPHMTIATNVGLVCGMLGWDKQRTSDRVDELLELVGLDAGTFRDRYPRQLSGGQQQRVGVARALAADPAVLLMDEPFGAVDPITRSRLQDELLRIQADVQKTIVFVTHDFDEAVKLGDRIAILQEGSRIAQFATPEEILSNPANEFVEDFIGAGAHLKRLNLSRVRDVALSEFPTVAADAAPAQAQRLLDRDDVNYVLLLDARGRPSRFLDSGDVNGRRPLAESGQKVQDWLIESSTLNDALDLMLAQGHGVAPVVGRDDRFAGVLTVETVMSAISRLRMDEQDRDAQRKAAERATRGAGGAG